VPFRWEYADVDLTFLYDGKKIERQVIPSTRISALRALISRTFGISVRKRRVVVIDGDGGGEIEIGEGDGSRDVGWFISGKKATVTVE